MAKAKPYKAPVKAPKSVPQKPTLPTPQKPRPMKGGC